MSEYPQKPKPDRPAQPVKRPKPAQITPTQITPGSDLVPVLPEAQPALTPAQQKAADKRAEKLALAENAKRLAQIVNLHIGGYSLADIGNAIGASADEVDRMLSQDASRYVRSQPALRVFVRNWISAKYTKLLEADWEAATDVDAIGKLENQDRVIKILDRMERLHGAAAPVQTEIKIDAAPEAVELMVAALASGAGLGFDMNIFDAEIVEDAVEQAAVALEVSSAAVEDPDETDTDDREGEWPA